MEKYYENFILAGDIDYYCLVCKQAFTDPKFVDRHVRWEKHRNNVTRQECVPNLFKADLIFKVDDHYYYCQMCDTLMMDITEHIKGAKHQARKTSNDPKEAIEEESFVKRNPDKTVVIQGTKITQNQWHGINNGMCLLCESNFSKIHYHKLSFGHIANLIKNKIKCLNNNYYREVQGDKFYCFKCFTVYENKYLKSHLSTCVKAIDRKKRKVNNSQHDTPKSNIMLEYLAKAETENFDIDVRNKTAKCLKCEASMQLSYKALDAHKELHEDASIEKIRLSLIFDHGKRRADIAKYGKENYIKLNEGGRRGYCSLCNIYISAHMNIAKQHVEGALHRGHLELKGFIKDSKHEKPPYKRVVYKTFYDVMFGPFRFSEYNVVLINYYICLDILSYSFICEILHFKNKKFKCLACDIILNQDETEKHMKEDKHSNIILHCKVLLIETEDYEEFVREIHPNLYHCGYCNQTFPFWENMAKHLKTTSHGLERLKRKVLSKFCVKNLHASKEDLEELARMLSL